MPGVNHVGGNKMKKYLLDFAQQYITPHYGNRTFHSSPRETTESTLSRGLLRSLYLYVALQKKLAACGLKEVSIIASKIPTGSK